LEQPTSMYPASRNRYPTAYYKRNQTARPLLPLTPDYQTAAAQTLVKDPTVYALTTPYPATWYTTSVGVGLNKNNQHVTFVSIQYNPIRYTPITGTLHIADTAEVTITYEPPTVHRFL